MTVAVIIPTFNHAHFLGDAISSVVAQTHRADEIIVVDDGSTDDPAAVLAGFANVRLVRQENRGLSAARNTGLRNCTTSHVIFLDADDRLLPNAIEAGVNCAALHSDCAFVYGGFYHISADGSTRGPDCFIPVEGNGYFDLIRFNVVAMVASALFRRECILRVGGFDETLKKSEDYDLYLRLARTYGFVSHPAIIAEYRIHGKNTSDDPLVMLHSTLDVLDRHEARIIASPSEKIALELGRASWRDFFAWRMLVKAYSRWGSFEAIRLIFQAIKTSRRIFLYKIPSRILRWMRGGDLITKTYANDRFNAGDSSARPR
jgi:glycosyltransferase involved in cell wall biosynthesis